MIYLWIALTLELSLQLTWTGSNRFASVPRDYLSARVDVRLLLVAGIPI